MDLNNAADVQRVKGQMHSLAFGQAMAHAAEDYKREILDGQRAAAAGPAHAEVDIDDLLDDPELEKLHAERLAQLQQEVEKRAKLQQQGHGTYEEVAEGDFLEVVTKSPRVVAHFFHQDFERCRIMDRHLAALAKKYFDTRFIKISAPDAPFFVEKLQVRMLPCIITFLGGVAKDRVVGFEALGGKDDFPTLRLERLLLAAGGVEAPAPRREDSDDEVSAAARRTVRVGFAVARQTRDSEDEDSDFD